MSIPAVPWWPPVGSHELIEAEVRQLFAYLRTITPSVMEDARRRIREHVGDDPIEVDYVMVGQLAGKRLGTIAVVTLIWLAARTGADTVSVTIGLRQDGRLATTMDTPESRHIVER